jgi:hypothetical protein
MRMASGLWVAGLVWPVAAVTQVGAAGDAGSAYVRDWQVERPLASGVLRGLSLGTVGGREFGSQPVTASRHDPYGMSLAVHGQLVRLGRPQHVVGVVLGSALWPFVLVGIALRRRADRIAAHEERLHVA